MAWILLLYIYTPSYNEPKKHKEVTPLSWDCFNKIIKVLYDVRDNYKVYSVFDDIRRDKFKSHHFISPEVCWAQCWCVLWWWCTNIISGINCFSYLIYVSGWCIMIVLYILRVQRTFTRKYILYISLYIQYTILTLHNNNNYYKV